MAVGTDERVTLTALFTDIEGSTRLWNEYPADAAAALELHDRLIGEAVAAHGGQVFQHTGDGLIARFVDPHHAVAAAIDAQRRLGGADWGTVGSVLARMGIHTGEVVERPAGVFGWALNFCSRLADVGHGGQVLISDATAALLSAERLGGIGVIELGRFGLRDVAGTVPIHQAVVADLRADFPAPRKTLDLRRTSPRGRTPLIGRVDDLSILMAAIETRQLVTVTGPPGVGKTRLAIEMSDLVQQGNPDREVLWTELVGVESEAIVPSIMTAHSVAMRPGVSALDSLVDWLSERTSLLVLDNGDGGSEVIRGLVEAVLDRAPSAHVVVTSQRVLDVPGEDVLRLGPLTSTAAAELFLDRAEAAGAHVSDVALATDICEVLEQLPFAIEIAATLAATFSLHELLRALRSGGLTAIGAGDRVRAVEQAVGLAIDGLRPAVRARLIAATVFSGAFDSTAFHAVCEPDSPSELSTTLTDLVGSSLLQPVDGPHHTMFRLLDPVRAVVETQSDTAVVDTAAARLRTYVLDLSAAVAAGLRGSAEQRWVAVFERHLDVVRGVFRRALDDGDLATAARLATDQWEWAFFHFNSEYFDWARQVLDRFEHRSEPRLGPVHGVVALGHWFRDELPRTQLHADEALRCERELGAEFSLPARLALINAAVFAGAASPPHDVFAESERFHRERPEGFYRMNVEAQNAIMATWLGQYDLAEARALKALQIARDCANPSSIAYSLWALGQAIEHDDPGWAEHLFDEALRLSRDVDNRWIVGLVQVSLASSRRRSTSALAAAGLLDDLLVRLVRAGHWAQVWNVVRLAALVAGDVGDDELAYQLLAAADAAEITFPTWPADAAALRELAAGIIDRRGETWTRRAGRVAATWSPTEAAQVALVGLARIIDEQTVAAS